MYRDVSRQNYSSTPVVYTVIPNEERFCPQGHLAMSNDIFSCHNWGEKC